ncbi:hypothetical protein GDO81_014116 [Engystomops pustulosus]|uniref:Uncharacterized protein n=1 Tax=Engystomops pustulosus TaxID=76066 RepID=A0AAV7B889_ENGPU|nr:hypothetical protein GDO81_014116 [Engystomops pustulosus]
MLPQRKLAWSDRKKKPKSEITPGKCGANFGKASYSVNRFHKTSGCRQHEGRKISYCEVTSSSLPLRDSSGTGRTSKKNSVAQNQFLPPIMTVGTDSCVSKQTCLLLSETLSRGPMKGERWRINTSSRNPERESLESANQEDALSPVSSPGYVVSLISGSWEHKTLGLDDLGRSQVQKTVTPDLYGSCLLVLASRGSVGKDSVVQPVSDNLRRTVDRSQRYLNLSKATKRGLSAWKSSEELNFVKKGLEKHSSGDSAFGTDTWSENAEVDIELGLELNTLEMDHYTHQRIMNWILQVNAALFSPHASEPLKCSLTEQDTSIKIVYDGD